MRFVAGFALLVALAGVAAAQGIHAVSLGDGWSVSFPGAPQAVRLDDEEVGPIDAHAFADGDGITYTAATGRRPRPLSGRAAEDALRARVARLRAVLQRRGDEARVVGVGRVPARAGVAIEARLSVRSADGRVVRMRSRLVQDGRRFIEVIYMAPQERYSPDMASWYLDSLTAR